MEWSEQEISSYIFGKIPEGTNLDYKRSAALDPFTQGKKNDLSKDVSAFANSEGGVLLYGINEEEAEGVPTPTDFDEGLPSGAVTAEQLEQVILSKVHPRIDGLKIFLVPLSAARPGKMSIVIEVPKSTTAHQASDHVYYKRYQYMNQPMEDYEVRDVMNRVKTAQVDVKVWCESYPENPSMPIFIQLTNVGTKAIRDIALELFTKNQKVFSSIGREYTPRHFSDQPGAESLLLTVNDVLHPSQETMLVTSIKNQVSLSSREAFYDEELTWTVYADDMLPKTGVILMSDYIHRTRKLNPLTGEIIP